LVKFLEGVIFYACGMGNTRIGYEDVQVIADQRTNLFGQCARTVRQSEVCLNRVGLTVGIADFAHQRLSMCGCSRRVADPQHGLKCGFQQFMNKQTEHAEGDDD
jgi:hypothetical protein